MKFPPNHNKKHTQESFVAKARAAHGDRYNYDKAVYVKSTAKVIVTCPEHGDFTVQPNNHYTNKTGCPVCAGGIKLTLERFIERSTQTHAGRYTYDKAVYRGVDNKVTITCPEHGDFEQIAFDHMKGRGCRVCGGIKANDSRTWTRGQFIEKAIEKFGDALDYSAVEYVNSLTPVTIRCPTHGEFTKSPHEHLASTGCPECSGLKPITRQEFIRRAREVHGDRYDYSAVNYSRSNSKVDVRCAEHGVFLAQPKDHISKGAGCPACARESTSSTGENELATWVESLGVAIVRNDRATLDGFEMDIYVPGAMVGIEYNGAYWHTDTALPHARIHEIKHLSAERHGIRLITVWDFQWAESREQIQRHILHAIGRNDGPKINARACEIVSPTYEQTKQFYSLNHLQGPAWRAIVHLGLMHQGTLVAAMSFTKGSSRRGKTGDSEWELIRFATSGIVRGGASKLFSSFVEAHHPDAIWSFSDRQHFGGGLYQRLGFTEDGRTPADYTLHHQQTGKRWHKSAWQRRHIQSRLDELGISDTFDAATDPRTEREMQLKAKALRIMDAGKVRWLWIKKTAQTEAGAAITLLENQPAQVF